MKLDEKRQNSMKDNETLWKTMKLNEKQWNSMKNNEAQWSSMKTMKLHEKTMKLHETPWKTVNVQECFCKMLFEGAPPHVAAAVACSPGGGAPRPTQTQTTIFPGYYQVQNDWSFMGYLLACPSCNFNEPSMNPK